MAGLSHKLGLLARQFDLKLASSSLTRALPTLQNNSSFREPSTVKAQHFSTITGSSDISKTLLHQANIINLSQRRFKRKKGKGARIEEEEEEDDDDDEELANENPLLVDDLFGNKADDSQLMTIDVNSLRLDSVAKVAFALSRAKVEELFYKGDIYVNGERASKKSQDLSLNDEIDIIKNPNEENPSLVDIRRCFITSLPDKATEQGRLKLKIKRWNALTVEAPSDRRRD